MYNNKLDEFATMPMVLTTERVVEGVRGILALAKSDPSLEPANVARELDMMFARDDSNPQPIDVAVYREVEDWVVQNWRNDSPPLVDVMATIILSCGMVRGIDLLREASESANSEVRKIAQDALAEAERDRLKGWELKT